MHKSWGKLEDAEPPRPSCSCLRPHPPQSPGGTGSAWGRLPTTLPTTLKSLSFTDAMQSTTQAGLWQSYIVPPQDTVPQLARCDSDRCHVTKCHVLRANQTSHFPEATQPGPAEPGWKLGQRDTRPGVPPGAMLPPLSGKLWDTPFRTTSSSLLPQNLKGTGPQTRSGHRHRPGPWPPIRASSQAPREPHPQGPEQPL